MKLAINIAVLLLLVGVVVSDIEEDLESKVLDKGKLFFLMMCSYIN